MTSNPPRSCSKCGAQGEFFLPTTRPHQQQIRHVCAGDQKKKSHSPQQQPQGSSCVTANNLFIYAYQVSGRVTIILWILLLQILGNGSHLCLRLCEGHVLLQAAN